MPNLRYRDDRSAFSCFVMPVSCLFMAGLLLGLTAAGLRAEDSLAADRKSDNQPNIVLIVADDMGFGDLSCQGAEDIRTPHLDRLARQGTRFTNFCVAQSVCTASRAALMSGCYPHRLGMAGALNHTSRTGLHADEWLLPEMLQAKGYATACFGKWHLGTKPIFFPTRNGFDTWAGLPYSNDNGPLHPTVRGIPPLPFYQDDEIVERDPDQAQFTSRLTKLSIEFIEANQQRPFFLYLPHVMPHVPIFASDKFRNQSRRGLYGDVVEELDAGIGQLLQKLDDLKLADNTLVLFISDNGPFLSYGDHAGSAKPLREGKLTTFEGGHRVPLLVRWPGHVPSGQVSDEFLTGLDLFPSLASLVGGKQPTRKIDGVDVLPALLGKPGASGRESFAYFSGSELHAVRSGRWKLHFDHEYLTVAGPPGTGGKPANFAQMKPNAIEQSGVRGIASRHGYRVEKLPQSLFDLQSDPGETKDLSAEHPEIVAKLQSLGKAVREELGDALHNVRGTGLRAAGVAE
jgi:arylsulfatase